MVTAPCLLYLANSFAEPCSVKFTKFAIANLVNFTEQGSAKELARYNRQGAVTITANINEGYTLSEAIKYFESVMTEIAPENQITWKGKSEEIKETSNEL